ncbi:MAG TPA: hypothetical protein VNV44_11970 [Solirubrobacteraceae bacterium]|nr:hypothetical protein [Solirubrobacteraceae bacterium]
MPRSFPITIAACSTLALAAAGCGSSAPAPQPSTAVDRQAAGNAHATPVPGALNVSRAGEVTAHSAAGEAPTAQYALFARLVNLRAADVPGFRLVVRRHSSSHIAALETRGAYRQCMAGGEKNKPVFRRSSQGFKGGSRLNETWLGSSVEIERSSAAAKRDLAVAKKALFSRSVIACTQRRFASLGAQTTSISIKGHHVDITVRDLRLVPLKFAPPAGTDAAAGFSMSYLVDYRFTVRGHRIDFPVAFYIESSVFVIGRAEVAFTAMSTSQPPSVRLEERLYATLVSRAVRASQVAPAAVRG